MPNSSRLLLLPRCLAISGYLTSNETSCKQWLASYKQEINLWVQVSQGKGKPPQMEDTHDNLSMLMLYLLFYA